MLSHIKKGLHSYFQSLGLEKPFLVKRVLKGVELLEDSGVDWIPVVVSVDFLVDKRSLYYILKGTSQDYRVLIGEEFDSKEPILVKATDPSKDAVLYSHGFFPEEPMEDTHNRMLAFIWLHAALYMNERLLNSKLGRVTAPELAVRIRKTA